MGNDIVANILIVIVFVLVAFLIVGGFYFNYRFDKKFYGLPKQFRYFKDGDFYFFEYRMKGEDDWDLMPPGSSVSDTITQPTYCTNLTEAKRTIKRWKSHEKEKNFWKH